MGSCHPAGDVSTANVVGDDADDLDSVLLRQAGPGGTPPPGRQPVGADPDDAEIVERAAGAPW
jgi:hypothetical protein